MSQLQSLKASHPLQGLMQQVGISSFKALAQIAGVSERQIRRLRQNEIQQMRLEVLLKLSQALQVSLNKLIVTCQPELKQDDGTAQTIADLEQEYQRLSTQLEQQQHILWQQFQQSSLQVIESWLLQWPTAAAAAQKNPQLPAVNLLPLLRPLEQLLQQWGLEAIAPVGAEVPYDPQLHQLMSGDAQKGDLVKIRYIGYCQGTQLLYRAKVSPSSN